MVCVVQEVKVHDLVAAPVLSDCIKSENILSRINWQSPTGNG